MAEDGAVTRSAEYVGSFAVDDVCLDEQTVQLHTQLEALMTCWRRRRRRPVSIRFSIKGVKIYDEDEKALLMAHALRRVSLSTARPADAQFAFVSHNPGSVDAQLYCHVFQARHARAAQFLNLLLCRCFQLSYLDQHPEEAQEGPAGGLPQRSPSLLNHGFPLSVSALVSFRRAPFLGLLPGAKKKGPKSYGDAPISQDEVLAASPLLVRKKAMRAKVLRSGAYRSFTLTPLQQRDVQERLNASAEKDPDQPAVPGAGAPSLAQTEEALAQAVWCWAGFAADSGCSLLAEDVLGSYLLRPHPNTSHYASLVVRAASGLVTHLVENTRKGTFRLGKYKREFGSLAELVEHYSGADGELPCTLSCARVNHCYEWEEKARKQPPARQPAPTTSRDKHPQRRKWL